MSRIGSPASRRRSASLIWWGVSFGGRPIFTPFALARSRPSPVRARINSRSNSASPPSTVSIRRPWAVVVSAHVSLSERKPAPLPVIAASVFNRSRVDRASRSRRVTVKHVALFKLADDAAQLGAVGSRAACRFPKDLLGSGGAQLLHLRVEALAVG